MLKILCPNCHERFGCDMPELKCKRCGYQWIPRTNEMPEVCAKCKSPYWDKERVRGVKNCANHFLNGPAKISTTLAPKGNKTAKGWGSGEVG